MTLAEAAVRSKHGINVVGIKRPKEDCTYARADTVLAADDLLIISGPNDLVERFAVLPKVPQILRTFLGKHF